MVEPETVQKAIEAGVPGTVHVEVVDLTGTKDHYQALVVASSFADKSQIQQHQAVYAALGDLMKGPVHALALKTLTPEQWSQSAEN